MPNNSTLSRYAVLILMHMLVWHETSSAIENSISIDSAWHDAETGSILIAYTVDYTAGLELGLQYGLNSFPTQDGTKEIFGVTSSQDTIRTTFSNQIVYDTIFYITLWLREAGLAWAPPTDSSSCMVKTSGFIWQEVSYFGGNDTLVTAANGRILLRKSASFFGVLLDTLRQVDPGAAIGVGIIQTGLAFEFAQGFLSPPFDIGIKYESIPMGITGSSMRIYRIQSNGQLHVEHNSYEENGIAWVRTNDLSAPFVVCADTIPPSVVLNETEMDTAGPVEPNSDVVLAYTVTDNIANAIWTLKYGPGRTAPRDSLTDTLNSFSQTITEVIRSNQLSEHYGLRILLIVKDGCTIDTINVSLQTVSTSTGAFVTPAQEWAPFHASAILDDPSPEAALIDLCPAGKPWAYDPSNFRIFRRIGCQWVEYPGQADPRFSWLPGRVFWIKTRESHLITLASGMSTSLKEPAVLILEPGVWTDFSLPFKFDILLRDIMPDNNLSDSLDIIQWNSSGAFEYIYAPGIPSLTSIDDTLRSSSGEDAYAVFNRTVHAVSLSIPAIPVEMSNTASKQRTISSAAKPADSIASVLTISDLPAYPAPIDGYSACGAIEHISVDENRLQPRNRSGRLQFSSGNIFWHAGNDGIPTKASIFNTAGRQVRQIFPLTTSDSRIVLLDRKDTGALTCGTYFIHFALDNAFGQVLVHTFVVMNGR